MMRVFLIIMMFFSLVAANGQKSETFVMPMNITPAVSGSFAELRTNHFHSGTDLSTVGKIGVPVYSVLPGFVSRIKVAWGGYGKALYIEHPNGMTSVYGHLSAYCGVVDSLVRAQQYLQESFEVEIHLKPGELNVAAGELVALSGNSGSSGGPHLHFEMRDTQTQDPVEPMDYLTYVKDDVAPVVYGIKIYPQSPVSKVAQGSVPIYYPVVATGGIYTLKDLQTITAAGKIGIGVHVVDFLTGNHRKCGVADIRLLCDGELIFHSNLSRISFANTRYVNSYIDYADRINLSRFIQKSFVDPNNRLECYIKKEQLAIEAGEVKKMRYEIRDARGNMSVVEFTIKGVDTLAKPIVRPLANGERRLLWRRGLACESDGVSVFIAPESVYRDEIIKIATAGIPDNPVYQVGSYDIPIHEPFELSIEIPQKYKSNIGKVYIAYIDNKNRYNYLGGSILNNKLIVKSRVFGRFTVVMDNTPPSVAIKPVQGNDYRNRQFIDITIKDEHSGIAYYRCEIDGKWQLFEYDPKTSLLRGDLKVMGLKRGGSHDMVVTVKDARGNEKIQKYSFIY